MRKVLFNLHLYLALIAGLFIVTIGVTGSIMAFEDDLDRIFNPGLFSVQPAGKPLSIADLFRAASAAFPGEKINNLRVPQSPTETVTFRVRGPKQVFMNPYNGQIAGTREGTSVLQTIHMIHLTLLVGPVGRSIVTFVTAVLLFLVLSGIYLWWQYKRSSVKWSASARRVNFDLHNAAGIYSAAFLIVLGITGITVHYGDSLEQYLHSRAGTRPAARNTPSAKPAGTVRPASITPDQAVESSLAALPGTRVLAVSVPPNPKASYFVAVRYPEDLTPGGRSWVNVDQYSGKAINIQSSRTAPTATRTIIMNRAIHTGDVFGYASKIVVCMSSLMLVIQAVTGYYLWWKKLRSKQLAAAPEREAVQSI